MTDSVIVLPPGFKVTDAAGAPASGAKIKFFVAGTSTPKTVYSDAALTQSLGSVVYTRSDGLPVASQGSSTTVVIYTGSAAYKLQITDSSDVDILPAKDNLRGALDTSLFLAAGTTSTLIIPVVSIAINTTLSAAHKGKLINASGDITLTMTAAATLADNWNVSIRCNDASNSIKLVTASGAELFRGPGFASASFALVGLGQAVQIKCDGGHFHIDGSVPPLMVPNSRIIQITSRITGAPVSPVAGARYLVTSAYSTFSVGDIIEATGQSTFITYTPPTDCGWLAYVLDENTYYSFQDTAWVSTKATQSQAEVGTSVVPFMTPLSTRQSLPARAYSEYTSNAALSTVIPDDDTIPQISEGTQILTASITLKAAANRVRVMFCGTAAHAVDNAIMAAALFRDAGVNALDVAWGRSANDDATTREQQLVINFEEAPGSVGPFTYSINVGASSGSLRMNGTSAARKFGGAARTTLILQEVYP